MKRLSKEFIERQGRFSRLPKDELSEISRRGGIASGEYKRRVKTMMEFAQIYFEVFEKCDREREKERKKKSTRKRKKGGARNEQRP